MSIAELISGSVLVVTLVGLALYFGRRQLQLRTRLRDPQNGMDAEERGYFHRQATRRLVCSLLMLIFAGFLIGWYFLQQELDQVPRPGPEEKFEHPLIRTVTVYWIAALLVLFGLLALATFDLIATARHGFRSLRHLEHQRRAELEEELAQYRRRRAEMN